MIANRFQPLEPIRPGQPLKARDLETAQTVVLHPIGDLDQRLVGICHPSLLTIFVVVDQDGQRFAACEFVPSRTLESLLAGSRWHPRRAAEIVAEVADAVAELHARGLAHGQISTAAVLLTTKGKAKLSLTGAITTSDATADVRALEKILEEMAGQPYGTLEPTDSAAVLAALLRSPLERS